MIKHDNIEKSLPLMVVMIVIALSWGWSGRNRSAVLP